jgi:hypothetical protein
VHVCTDANYDNSDVQCASDDQYVEDLSAARWVVDGPDGGDFTSRTVTFIIPRKNVDGSETDLRSYTDQTFDLTSSSASNTLASLFDDASVEPENEQTYVISAQEPYLSLGSTTFTYTGS